VIFRDQIAFDRLNAQRSFKFSIQRRPFSPYDLHWVRERKLFSVNQIGVEHMIQELGGNSVNRQSNINEHFTRNPQTSTTILEKQQATLQANWPTPSVQKSLPSVSGATTHEFEVKVEPWKGTHRGYLERTTYWGPFRVVPSVMQHHLSKIVPVPGLSDVDVHREPAELNISYRKSQELANSKTLKELYESSQGAKLEDLSGTTPTSRTLQKR
jgi:hypothetical protein